MADPKTAGIRDLLKFLARYEATPPTLEDGEAHHLRLTQDAKLLVYDPDTHGDVQAIEGKLDDPATGLAALKALVEGHDADVKGVGWTDQSLVALKGWQDARPAERGTDGAELETAAATRYGHLDGELEDIRQKATNPAWDQDTDSLEAIRERLDQVYGEVQGLDGAAMRGTDGAALAEYYTSGRAAKLDYLDAYISSRALASVCTEARLSKLDAAVSSRSSHSAEGVLHAITHAGDPANSLGRRIYDYLDAKVSEAGGATAAEVWGYATRRLTNLSDARAAYIDQLDFNLKEKMLEIDAEVEGLGGAAMRGTNGAALASVWTAARAAKLDRDLSEKADILTRVDIIDAFKVTLTHMVGVTASGTFAFKPDNVYDGSPASCGYVGAVGQYAQLDFGAFCILRDFRMFGDEVMNSNTNGRWKIQYQDVWGDWYNLHTGIVTIMTETWGSWTNFASQPEAKAVRITCTTYDANSKAVGELQVRGIKGE